VLGDTDENSERRNHNETFSGYEIYRVANVSDFQPELHSVVLTKILNVIQISVIFLGILVEFKRIYRNKHKKVCDSS
jgi:hypothetical protein